MKRGLDVAVHFDGFTVIHHNQPERETPSHTHQSSHQLILVLQGEVLLSCDGGIEFTAGAHRSVYLPPGLAHAFRSTNAVQGERLIAHVDTRVWEDAGGSEIPPGVSPTQSLVQELLFFLLLHKETRHARVFAHALVQATSEAHRLVGGELQGGAGALDAAALEHLISRVTDERVRKAVHYVSLHAATDMPAAQVAKAAGLSERNLSRLFAAETGLSVKQMQTRLRVGQACVLLEAGKISVTDVAFSVGYSGLAAFLAAFRAVTGVLPSQWRESGRRMA